MQILELLKNGLVAIGILFAGIGIAWIGGFFFGFLISFIFAIILVMAAWAAVFGKLLGEEEGSKKFLYYGYMVVGTLLIIGIITIAIWYVILPPQRHGFGRDPLQTIKDNFRDLHSMGGIGISSPKQITFLNGDKIVRQQIIASLPIQSTDIGFICNDPTICLSGSLEITNGDALLANKALEATLVTCANEKSTGYQYVAAFSAANNPGQATKDCEKAAELNG